MSGKAKPGWHKKIFMPPDAPKGNADWQSREADQKPKPDSLPKVAQPVVRSVSQLTVIHFYLACGHMVTFHRSDFPNTLPSVIDCWACAEENKKS